MLHASYANGVPLAEIQRRTDIYADYLNGTLKRQAFYAEVPSKVISSVIHAEIGDGMLPDIFRRVDDLIGKRGLDVIIGGPPCQAYSVIGRARVGNEMKSDKGTICTATTQNS